MSDESEGVSFLRPDCYRLLLPAHDNKWRAVEYCS